VDVVSSAASHTRAGGSPGRKTLVVVPTYNERGNIPKLVRRLLAIDELDVLFVDDSSPDGTADLIKESAASADGRIHLLSRPSKQGLGTAYVDGFRWGLGRNYETLVQMDADLSHDPADIPRLLGALVDADLIIGSRYIEGGRVQNWGLGRRTLSFGANWIARVLLGYGVHDSTAGFRAFRSDVLQRIDFHTLRSRGYAFQVETTRRVFRGGGRIVEVPITFVERTRGSTKMDSRVTLEAVTKLIAWAARDRLWRRRAGGSGS
jgi:dolichol-phosphate mannosyltransferase